MKPLFSEKCLSADNITLIENGKIVSGEQQLADIFNDFFQWRYQGSKS